MQKRIVKRLKLSKETLHALEQMDLVTVRGRGTTGNNWCTEGWTCPAYTGCQPIDSTKCVSTYYTICDCPPII